MAELISGSHLPIPIGSLVGGIISQYLTVACFALIVYEYLVTLDEEVKHFWKGPFSISRALFFFNRYFPFLPIFVALLCQTLENPSDEFCNHGIRATFMLTVFGIGIIQAILIARVWFLFPGDKYVHFGLLFSFIISFSVSIFFVSVSMQQLRVIPLALAQKGFGKHIMGCHAARPPNFWRTYLPSLVLHTGLYGLTVHQAIASPQCAKLAGMRWKLLADGGVFYLIVLCSVSLTSIGAFLMNVPEVNVPAIFSPIVLTTTSIATSRIMFSLRSIIESDEDGLEWVNTTNGPAMPLPGSSLPSTPVLNRTTPLLSHRRRTSLWAQKQLIITPRPNLKQDMGVLVGSEKRSDAFVDDDVMVFPNLSASKDATRYTPEQLWKARYGNIYDEERGIDEAYKRVMKTGSGVFF